MIEPGTLVVPYFDSRRVGSSEAMIALVDDDTWCTVISLEVQWRWCVESRAVELKQYASTHVWEHRCVP
jgi:hypothetical protein